MEANDQDKLPAALEKVFQISRQMVATTDLDELLGLIIGHAMELLEAERATLFLYDAQTNEMISRIAAGVKDIRFSADMGIAGAVVRSRCTLNISDAYADERFNRDIDSLTGYRTRNLLALPLLDYSSGLVGVLEVINKRSGDFGSRDIALAEMLAAQAGVMLQRARLLEHYGQKLQMEQSLAIARAIQQDLLPRHNPAAEGFDIAGWSCPADETGGDVYDFFPVGPHRWTITLADATGHGIGPAMVIAEARAMLRALSLPSAAEGGSTLDIAAIVSRVNDLLVADLASSRFVTCLFALLDAAASSFRYVSAGQGPLLLYRRGRDVVENLAVTGIPLGIAEGTSYADVAEIILAPGDVLVALTDGFYEAANADNEQFGTERVSDIVRSGRDKASAEIIEDLRRAVNDFAGTTHHADDLTAVIVRKTATA